MRILILFSLTVFSFTSTLADEYKEAWGKTNYTINSLFSEVEFQPESCQRNLKEFTACMVALNFLANNLPTPLQFRIDILADEPILLVSKTGEESVNEQVEQFKESLGVVFNQQTPLDISKHYWRLFELAKTIEVDATYIAAESMNIYLQLAYDPHSHLLPRELVFGEAQKYFGVGSFIIKNRVEAVDESEAPAPIIMKPMKGSPAMRDGVMAGDLLYEIDGADALSLTIDEVAEAIKGPEKTTVSLKLKRFCTGETEIVDVVRGPITVAPDIVEDSYYVDFETDSADIKKSICEPKELDPAKPQALYIPVTHFDSPRPDEVSLCDKFYDLLTMDANNPNSLGLIIDLRQNPGGDVDQVSCMLDLLISSEDLLLGAHNVYKGEVQEGPNSFEYYFSSYQVYEKPVIVLTGYQSASASEIFSGTIQDMKRGWVVGDKTFGKGSIQSLYAHTFEEGQRENKLNYSGADTVIKTTTGIYYLNSGRSPQILGITPDFRYDPKGEAITEDNEKAKEYSEAVNVVKGFENKVWVQNRPEEALAISECAQSSESLSQIFIKKSLADLPENLSVITNFQDLLARDILSCLSSTPQE